MEKLEEASIVFQYIGMSYYDDVSNEWLREAKALIDGQGPSYEKNSLDKTIQELKQVLREQENK